MKKQILLSAAALMLASGRLPAQEVVKPAPTAVVPTLSGEVVKINGNDRVVLMKTADGKEVRLHVLPNAKIMVNRRAVTLADLADGVPIRVQYTDKAGTYEVSNIESPVLVVPDKPATVVTPPAVVVPARPGTVTTPPVVVPAQPAVVVAGGNVVGVVMEGERPQPNIGVTMLTQEGKVVASTRTHADGSFRFSNIAPGSYRVVSDKIASQTKGETLVTIKSGQTLRNTVVNLVRPPLP